MQDVKGIVGQLRQMLFMVGRCIGPQCLTYRVTGLLDGSLPAGCVPADLYLALVRRQDPPLP